MHWWWTEWRFTWSRPASAFIRRPSQTERFKYLENGMTYIHQIVHGHPYRPTLQPHWIWRHTASSRQLSQFEKRSKIPQCRLRRVSFSGLRGKNFLMKWSTWISISKTVNLFEIGWAAIDKSQPKYDGKSARFFNGLCLTRSCWRCIFRSKCRDCLALWWILNWLPQVVSE